MGSDSVILTAYFLVLSVLAVYGLHRYHLVHLYFKHRNRVAEPAARFESLPTVTVQLPVFNERYVVGRLIDAVCRLDYPRSQLEIQVLDDSTDDTTAIARERVRHYRRQGFEIRLIRRPDRQGYKAGALAHGMAWTDSTFFAIFDADFLPRPETLRRMIDFFTDPRVGMVQARWSHLNRDYSLLTRLQSILLDGHFVLESGGRWRSGRFFNFNGTAGLWRREAIAEAGGWQADTLTEDLDLSYRAQLCGWRFVFLEDFTAPGELPLDMNSFKSQQYRWAKGAAQTARKLLPRILREKLPWQVKTEAFFHLTANVAYPLVVLLGLLALPALKIRLDRQAWELFLVDFPLFLAAFCSVSTFYAVSQRAVTPRWTSRLKFFPALLGLGLGMSLSNSRAVLEGLLGVDSPFQRTPKFGQGRRPWRRRLYRSPSGLLPALELALGTYFAYLIALCWQSGALATAPFLALFCFGFLYAGLTSLLHR